MLQNYITQEHIVGYNCVLSILFVIQGLLICRIHTKVQQAKYFLIDRVHWDKYERQEIEGMNHNFRGEKGAALKKKID